MAPLTNFMDLTLTRDTFTGKSTSGELFIDGDHVCYTLELPNVDGLPGSCIPRGTYKIEMQPSPKFMASDDVWVKQYAEKMPHVTGIPNRSLIMIHWGNAPADTDGCILVGWQRDADEVIGSRKAFEELYPKLSDGDTLTVVGGAMQQPVPTLDVEE